MALVKPTINDISAFDATSAYTVTFTASGGDQVVKNEIYITLNNDSSESSVYNNTVTTYDLSHNIPANTLANGNYYKVRIRTYDRLNNVSVWSDYYPFRCYTTPTLSFINGVPSTITTSSYDFGIRYTQIEHEKLDYAIIRLYNNNNVEIKNSGNLYSTSVPPITFNYRINNLENHKQYKIKATAMTVEGTVVDTGFISFIVNYGVIPTTDKLVANVHDCDNYINIQSTPIMRVSATSNPTTLNYLYSNKEVDLISTTATLDKPLYTSWVKYEGLNIPSSFLLRLWFRPARQPFKILTFENENSNISFNITYYKGNTTDYINIQEVDNSSFYPAVLFNRDIALNTRCNGNTKVFLWFKNANPIEARCEIVATQSTKLSWNHTDTNNIKYNVTSNIKWLRENYGSYVPSGENISPLSNFSTITIANGVFDHLNVSKNLTLPYSTDIPTATSIDDILNMDFNGRIGDDSNYTRLLLKRKDETMADWINVSDINVIPINTPVYIDFNDSFIPSDVEQTYGLVTYINNEPNDYYTIKVTPKWAKYSLSDITNKFTLNYAVIYSNHTQNIQNGVFMPLGAKYPIVIQNGESNYKSGSLQFKVLGYQFEENHILNRISMTKQLNDILDFLTNGKPKCLTDFNGNIYIFKVINSPQISYDANWGNSIPVVSFDWVEQSKYNNVADMTSLGFYNVATE